MFTDLRNFTALSEMLEPQQLMEFLNDYFVMMKNCIDLSFGVIDKYIGDAIMAHWIDEQDEIPATQRAINTALLMRNELINFNRRYKDSKMETRFGCGINTGPVIYGHIGVGQQKQKTVIGSPVNIASRVEGLNKVFGTDILISESSLLEVPDMYQVVQMPAIRIKGKSQKQRIFAVLGRVDDPQCIRDLSELRRIIHIPKDKRSILIVDDDPDMVRLIELTVAKEDYRILSASTGHQALQMIREQGIDLIVLDLSLPDIDGLQLCRQLKESNDSIDVPILMLTGRNDDQDIIIGLNYGADDYMTKPFNRDILLARIKAIFRRKDHAEGAKFEIVQD